MRDRLPLDVLSGIGFLALNLVVGMGAGNLGIGTVSDPGPGMYPVVLACAGAALSIALAVAGLRAKTSPASATEPAEQANWRAAGIAVLALVAYVLLLPVFGIAGPSVALLALLFWMGGLRNIYMHVGLSLLLGIGAEVACRLMGIPLPEAIFWQLTGGA